MSADRRDWRREFERLRSDFMDFGHDEAQRWALASLMPAFLKCHPESDGSYRRAAVLLGRLCGSDLTELEAVMDLEFQ